jgi:hypothetical protein
MKKILFILLLSITSYGQIKIDDVGTGWKVKVEQALLIIQNNDTEAYDMVKKNYGLTSWLEKEPEPEDNWGF